MVLSMPSPYKHPKTGVYWYRQRVPASLGSLAKGKTVTVTIDGKVSTPKIGVDIKVSLGTKDPKVAKQRAKDAQDQFDLIWASFDNAPVHLTLRQCVALSGEIYRLYKSFEDEPEAFAHLAERKRQADEERERWERDPRKGLKIRQHATLQERWGTWVDAALADRHLRVDEQSYQNLLREFDRAYGDAATLLERRAGGDFGHDATEHRFPPVEIDLPKAQAPLASSPLSFVDIIDAERKHRAMGRDGKPLPDSTVTSWTRIAGEFAKHRGKGGEDATTVTSGDLEAWKKALLEGGKISNRTVAQKVGVIKTLVKWGLGRFKDNPALRKALKAVEVDLVDVELPDFVRKPSDISAIQPDEAPIVLRAARKESDPRLRWLPWICAYTGLRISEAKRLRTSDFFESEGLWFFEVSSSGQRSLKTVNSRRRVPVHPALLDEGLREYVNGLPPGPLFEAVSDTFVNRWFHGPKVNINRPGVSPNHGWRHLFEDLCFRDGMLDKARLYLTGHSTGGADQQYGKTYAMLPGLWREVAKIRPFDLTPKPQPNGGETSIKAQH